MQLSKHFSLEEMTRSMVAARKGIDNTPGAGEIKFISFHKGVVRLLLSGSCSGCAMSKATLQRGVEGILKHYVPEVQGVIGEDDEKAEEQGYTPYMPKDKEPDWKKLVRHKYE